MRFENGNHHTEYLIADSLVELTRLDSTGAVSLQDVAFAANIHRNTVYYHFKDMAALVRYTITRQLHLSNGSLPSFFNKNSRLLHFAIKELGTEKYLSFMRKLLSPSLGEILANQIAAASLVEDQPAATIEKLINAL